MISLTNVVRTYTGPPSVNALRGVDLQVDTGDYCAIRGPSGSGKSTLLNVLGLLDLPDQGRYCIGPRDVSSLRGSEIDRLRATTFGFVFQAAYMVGHWSVAANVALGLRAQQNPRRERSRAVLSALDMVGMLHRVTGKASDLSGGERQRAAIARAICTRPKVLLADEPTGNLDSANADGVLEIFDTIRAGGVTVIVVTHDDRVANRADRVIEVQDGKIVVGASREPQ